MATIVRARSAQRETSRRSGRKESSRDVTFTAGPERLSRSLRSHFGGVFVRGNIPTEPFRASSRHYVTPRSTREGEEIKGGGARKGGSGTTSESAPAGQVSSTLVLTFVNEEAIILRYAK